MNEVEVHAVSEQIERLSREIAKTICMGKNVEIQNSKNGLKLYKIEKSVIEKDDMNATLNRKMRVEIYRTDKGLKFLQVIRKGLAD